MKYKIIKPFGDFKKWQIIDDQKYRRIVKRKLEEGGTLEPVEKEAKMENSKYENKMDKKNYENKGGK